MTSGEGTLWADGVRCLGGDWGGEEAARNSDHEPPAFKRKAGRSASDRVGHTFPMENAGFAGSPAEQGGLKLRTVEPQLGTHGPQ